MSTVLEIRNLQVSYYTESGRARALAGVDLTLEAGQKLGLVGESGSGKSTMALAMMRMIKPPGRIEFGAFRQNLQDLFLGKVPSLSHSGASLPCLFPALPGAQQGGPKGEKATLSRAKAIDQTPALFRVKEGAVTVLSFGVTT